MYELSTEELRQFLEQGYERWHGYVSPIYLLLDLARDMAIEDEKMWPPYWEETLRRYLNEATKPDECEPPGM
jgi:hypothetical protein